MRKQADLSPRLVECEPTSQVKQETAASPQAIESSSLGASFKEPATTADPKKIVRDPKKAKSGLEAKPKNAKPADKRYEFVDKQFDSSLLRQILDACSTTDDGFNYALYDSIVSVLNNQTAIDHFELMLMNHMAGINSLLMQYIGSLTNAGTTSEIEIIGNQFNKLARTFLMQMDARQRYRFGGDQKVSVQNVSVNDGGQAIVGNVTQNASGNDKVKVTPIPPAIADTHITPMPTIEVSAPRRKIPEKQRARR